MEHHLRRTLRIARAAWQHAGKGDLIHRVLYGAFVPYSALSFSAIVMFVEKSLGSAAAEVLVEYYEDLSELAPGSRELVRLYRGGDAALEARFSAYVAVMDEMRERLVQAAEAEARDTGLN